MNACNKSHNTVIASPKKQTANRITLNIRSTLRFIWGLIHKSEGKVILQKYNSYQWSMVQMIFKELKMFLKKILTALRIWSTDQNLITNNNKSINNLHKIKLSAMTLMILYLKIIMMLEMIYQIMNGIISAKLFRLL